MKYLVKFKWGRPYTPAPSKEILWQGIVESNDLIADNTPEINALRPQYPLGCGYAIFVTPIVDNPKPQRTWSEEAKRRVRRGNLLKRLEKKHPLFTNEFAEREYTLRPTYFFTNEELSARKTSLQT